MLASVPAGPVGMHARAGHRRSGGRSARWRRLLLAGVFAEIAVAAAWLAVPAAPSTTAAVNVPGLLSAADAGPGWTATHIGALAAEPAGCFRPRASLMASTPSSLVAVLLTAPAGIPSVDELAARYPSASRATAGFDSLVASMHACRRAQEAGINAAIAPIAVAPPGYDFSAVRLSAGAGAGDAVVGADDLAARKGTGVVLVVYGTVGAPDATAVGHLASTALARLGP